MDSEGHIKICDFGLSKQGVEGKILTEIDLDF